MIKSNNYFTQHEAISLSKEIVSIAPTDTPLTSLLLNRGLTEKASSTIHTWRERSLSLDEDISTIEGNKDVQTYQTGRAELNNALELFQKGAEVSGTAMAMKSTTLSQEVTDRLTELKTNLERAITRSARNDGSTTPFIRRMQGLESWVDPSNIVTASTPTISEADVKAVVKKLWDAGLPSGEYFGLVNADLKEQIDELYKDKYSYIAQQNVFGIIVDTIRTNYGNLNLILSRHASPDKLTVFEPSFLKIAYLREPQFEALAKTGDAVSGMVLAEATLKVASKKALAQLTI
ncbi:DUF5309 domain-containing protein [Paenibacillus tritici]|uniref:SU10 major capsid protein n=1 Tax=Paenibacillus tritici TaxID=1873425 RepID=UPI001BA844CA|nr:DUF5309 family protein [Paenibacillus tritici]QUL57346.1 DUF5309 domain-containing protein [Paenibacillus tritici]